MNEQEAKQQLSRVFVAYPTIRRELENMPTGNETLDAWCRMLLHCDLDDVKAVVDEIVDGDREPYGRYEKFDATAKLIRFEANDRRAKRHARQKQQVKYHDACNAARSSDAKLGRYWRMALHLGSQTRAGVITVDENQQMMSALRGWYLHGSEYPEWLHGVLEERARQKAGA